jgi:predicted RNA-binding Zn ribbon-like protein
METSYEAPGRLELVRRFVNTRDVEKGTDAISDVSCLSQWLTEQGLLEPSVSVSDRDVTRAHTLREALRAALLANHDRQPPPVVAVHEFNAAARRAALTPVLLRSGDWQTQPSAHGADAALGVIVASIVDSMGGSDWPRLKVCVNDQCLWAFYDGSRSHARRWCSMDLCGNRVKQQTWRDRQR